MAACGAALFMAISIHAPHARSDGHGGAQFGKVMTFQSTLLMRGATIFWQREAAMDELFQSTLLMRGATVGTFQQFAWKD